MTKLNYIAAVIALGFSTTASANIYRYVDSTGKVFLSNHPHVVHKSPTHKKIQKKHRVLTHKEILKIVYRVSRKHGVDPHLIQAILENESSYKAEAVSSVGAVGLMQLMPATAEQFGVSDRSDPEQSIEGGVKYIRYLLTMFNENTKLAVAGYNAGHNAVKRYNNRVPPYTETRLYVKHVLMTYSDLTQGA